MPPRHFNQHKSRHKPVISRIDDRLSLSFDELRVQSEMRLAAPDELVLGYTRTMMGFVLFEPAPKRIAIIGLGGGSLLKYCYANLPDTQITVVEIDSAVIALRERFFIPPDDTRLQVLCEDGADFVRRAEQIDVLLVDGFTEFGQPPSLSTQRFYNDCYQCLTAQGLLIVNLSDLSLGFAALRARIRHSFSHAMLAIDAEESTNQIIFAGKGGTLSFTQAQLAAIHQQLAVHPTLNLPLTLQSLRAAVSAAQIPYTAELPSC